MVDILSINEISIDDILSINSKSLDSGLIFNSNIINKNPAYRFCRTSRTQVGTSPNITYTSHIYVSNDFINWNKISQLPGYITKIDYIKELKLYYASTGTNIGATYKIFFSPDLVNWSSAILDDISLSPNGLIYVPELERMVIGSYSGIFYSNNNGSSWSQSNISSGPWTNIIWSSTHNKFVAIPRNNGSVSDIPANQMIAQSTDGITWTQSALIEPEPISETSFTRGIYNLIYHPILNKFIINFSVASLNHDYAMSDDLITWSKYVSGMNRLAYELLYIPEKNITIRPSAFTYMNTRFLFGVTTDCINWELSNPVDENSNYLRFNHLVWSKSLEILCARITSPSHKLVYSSDLGITWTSVDVLSDNEYNDPTNFLATLNCFY